VWWYVSNLLLPVHEYAVYLSSIGMYDG
jgi:hypothetical protein